MVVYYRPNNYNYVNWLYCVVIHNCINLICAYTLFVIGIYNNNYYCIAIYVV